MSVTSYRAPLLWLLIPMIGGYTMGHFLPPLPVLPTLLLAFICLAIAFWVSRKRANLGRQDYWAYFMILGVSVASLLYYQQNRQFPELWNHLPPREAFLELKVKQLYASNDPEIISGLATVIKTEAHLNPLLNYPIYFSANGEDHQIDRGDSLQLRGVLNYLPSKEDHSLFEQYLIGQSISLTLTRAYLTETPEKGNLFEQLIGSLRSKAINTLQIDLSDYPEELSIYRGMLLGIKGELSAENKEIFLKTGTLHLFAISGLHIGIIAITVASIFLVLRVPRRISVILGIGLVYLYVEITGASPSAVRAFAMTAFFWIGKSLIRQMPPFQALVASAVAVLIVSPTQLFSAGFQLSYTVVSGILLWGIPLYQSLRESWHARIPQKQVELSKGRAFLNKSLEIIGGTFCISLSATLASAPLSILYFGILAPFAVFLNMVLIPMASLVIIAGLFSIIGSLFFLPTVSGFLNHGPLLLIQIMDGLLGNASRLPNTFVNTTWATNSLGIATVILFLGSLLFVHSSSWRKRWKFAFPIVITVGMILVNSLIPHT
ncbi:MAG: ComEC/Rec2 family competence protein [Verrucomicrobia bacterium]|nr:ComEC/Rec2 family competence protein [Verrucomicrobiota bacterium]MDA1067534.1 ComEC/Rec2 family competence protein [Verrucomicrobiota bacterium]